jgi:hypothetical protein
MIMTILASHTLEIQNYLTMGSMIQQWDLDPSSPFDPLQGPL